MLFLGQGSPPQVRGKLGISPRCRLHGRITPAGAGKTVHSFYLSGFEEDHPRRCGENSIATNPPPVSLGSPPQVRGKPWDSRAAEDAVRITPAGAGKTRTQIMHCFQHQDHPRRCGENLDSQKESGKGLGSPPQVRGKPFDKVDAGFNERITPAGAGKTRSTRNCNTARKDHPRRCGENHITDNLSAASSGSPPQVRGKQ